MSVDARVRQERQAQFTRIIDAIYPGEKRLMSVLDTAGSNVVLLEAAPGSGKTSNLAAMSCQRTFINKGLKTMLVQDPRVACSRMRKYMNGEIANGGYENGLLAGQVNMKLGGGVSVGDEKDAMLTYTTTGWLKARLKEDNIAVLNDYGTLFIDEAHMRSMATELVMMTLGRVIKDRMRAKKPIDVIIMSATLDIPTFRGFLESHGIPARAITEITVEKPSPYTVLPTFLPATTADREEEVFHTLDLILKQHGDQFGGIMVFMPGQPECWRAWYRVMAEEQYKVFRDDVYVLTGGTSGEEAEIMMAKGGNKLLFCTPIVETGITIEGISIVIDSGVHKVPVYDELAGVTLLTPIIISKAAAKQRAHRTGRRQQGWCYRLYTKDEHHRFADYDMAPPVMDNLHAWIIEMIQFNPGSIPTPEGIAPMKFISNPPVARIENGLCELFTMGVLCWMNGEDSDEGPAFTDLGEKILNSSIQSFSFEARVFLAQSAVSDGPAMRHQMCSIAAHLSCLDYPLVTRRRRQADALDKDKEKRRVERHATSLNIRQVGPDCGKFGDIYAEVHAFNGSLQSCLDFEVAKSTDERRDTVYGYYSSAQDFLGPAPEHYTPWSDLELGVEIVLRALRANPWTLIKIDRVVPAPNGEIQSVKATLVYSGAEVTVSKDTIFDFRPYKTSKQVDWHTNTGLHFIAYTLVRSGSQIIVNNLLLVSEHCINRYNNEEWNGKMDTLFKCDMSEKTPLKLLEKLVEGQSKGAPQS